MNFLDLCIYLDSENNIQYKGYSKPTDSKRYLNPNSFHPRAVFDAIPFSQFLRTLRNNSKEETATKELDDCQKHFENSGYNKEALIKLQQNAINKTKHTTEDNKDTQDTVVFPVHYFDGIKGLKEVVRNCENGIKSLIGDVRIMR